MKVQTALAILNLPTFTDVRGTIISMPGMQMLFVPQLEAKVAMILCVAVRITILLSVVRVMMRCLAKVAMIPSTVARVAIGFTLLPITISN